MHGLKKNVYWAMCAFSWPILDTSCYSVVDLYSIDTMEAPSQLAGSSTSYHTVRGTDKMSSIESFTSFDALEHEKPILP